MLTYIMRRLAYMVVTIILISMISFLIIKAPPGNFLTSIMQELRSQYGTEAQRRIVQLTQRYGLDQPGYKQYLKWMQGIILRGDFGRSFRENRPVLDVLAERLPYTLLIGLLTIFFQYTVGVAIGIYSALNQRTVGDYIFTFLAFIGRSIPNFLLALVIMFIFSSFLGWSVGGLFSPQFREASWSFSRIWDLILHLIPPVVVIGTAGTAGIVRVLRGTMLDELGKEYVQTARSKGIPEWKVILRHPLKVAILPIISTIGWQLPRIFSGATITAIVLNLPTVGSALYNSLLTQDMYLAGSIVLMFSTLTVIGTLISDILLAKIDPRIRYT